VAAEVDNFNLDTQDISEDSFFTILQDLKFDPAGLLPAIVQDAATGQVLMMAWMNAESLRLTLSRGETWFWSRSRQALWHKGGSSGNIQKVRKIYYDCDGDTLLIQVAPAGPACHTGQTSCFYRELELKEA
jgi:phosphoribosyl-ATP pyrophosphohydrolase/phosphoribosyl-AMP cyclohydrolase